MRIAIIAAMGKELELILKHFKDHTERKIGDMTVYEGIVGRHEIVAAQCGIGKVNSALRTWQLIEEYKPDLVINSGVAGGADSSMHIGEILVADRVAYHDVWCGPGTKYGAADGFPVYFKPYARGLDLMKELKQRVELPIRYGLLCSGDKFISTPSEVEEIKSHFADALGCDMESASIAQTCAIKEIPFMIVRVMSDMPGGGENITEYQNFWGEAPERTFEVVSRLIEKL